MELSHLESFINVKDKGSLGKEKKDTYKKQLIKLLNEEDYSEQAEKYIFGGTPIESVMALFKYLSNCTLDRAKLNFDKFIKGKMHSQNIMGSAFKRDLTFLAILINSNLAQEDYGKVLIIQIINSATNKEGKLWGDFAKTVERYFVQMIIPTAEFPDLSEMDLQPKDIKQFNQIITDALFGIKVPKQKDILIIDKIRQWLTTTEVTPVSKDNCNGKDSSVNNLQDNTISGDLLGKQDTCSDREKFENKKPLTKMEQLISIANYLNNLEHQVHNLIKVRDELQQRNLLLESTQIMLEKKLGKCEENLIEQTVQKESLYNEVLTLNSHSTKLERRVEELTGNIQKRDVVLSIFESDKESSQKEQLNAIASKLRSEYQDFKDAVDMEMTIDLGENMRQQLSTVFKILAKQGIDIERR